MSLPLGLRSNNPTNLRPSNPPWEGQVGVNEKGFAIFDTMESGIRAPCLNLMAYSRKYGINTIRKAISRWSTTDVDAYIAFVCHVCEVGPDDKLDFTDRDTLFWLITGMGEMENGSDEFTHNVTDAQIYAGIERALGTVADPVLTA